MSRLRDGILALVGTGLGLGYVPIAPGTCGALLGVALFVAISAGAAGRLHPWLILGALAAVSAITVALGPWAERHWRKRDPGAFVTDEVAGFLATVLLFRTPSLWLTVIWAFAMTRLFDILKPPPARQLERLPAGWGILADDLCSSLYAAGVLHIGAVLVPHWFGFGSAGAAA